MLFKEIVNAIHVFLAITVPFAIPFLMVRLIFFTGPKDPELGPWGTLIVPEVGLLETRWFIITCLVIYLVLSLYYLLKLCFGAWKEAGAAIFMALFVLFDTFSRDRDTYRKDVYLEVHVREDNSSQIILAIMFLAFVLGSGSGFL
ncbi:hypothetical protein [Aestuariispira insulae]|uniref:Uncharacterized protein n=1 Tax=Aestuariispira insulae TaxID=1461337 RepID=A0A3D9H4P2_9PROT|nr:hypothetical protein [Aestuariispira insulae]RED44141.1 hypothetical protein DFP90_11745 [Aestuariispira insulae]